mgnify:CR=1 FL=1
MIDNKLILEIATDLQRDYPREGCGLLVNKRGKLKWVYCDNVAEGEEEFKIDPKQYVAARLSGDIYAVVHSHPDYSCEPSGADIKASDILGIPYFIISLPSLETYLYEPEYNSAPLLGREYDFKTANCWSLVKDYYLQKLNIELPTIDWEDDWWEKGLNYFEDMIEPFGFYEVDQVQEHDVILFKIQAPVESHCGVYLQEDIFMHHAENRLSCRESLQSRYFAPQVTRYMRCRQLD